jgi:hypothetical protein
VVAARVGLNRIVPIPRVSYSRIHRHHRFLRPDLFVSQQELDTWIGVGLSYMPLPVCLTQSVTCSHLLAHCLFDSYPQYPCLCCIVCDVSDYVEKCLGLYNNLLDSSDKDPSSDWRVFRHRCVLPACVVVILLSPPLVERCCLLSHSFCESDYEYSERYYFVEGGRP